jgi:hypothetical protein
MKHILTLGWALVFAGLAWHAALGTGQDDKLRSSIQIVPGKFGKALDAAATPALIEGDPHFRKPPLTVECWAKLHSKKNFNVLVASDAKSSSLHWEIYSYAGTGCFSAYLPGKEPSEIVSGADICDGQWHYVAMLYDGQSVRLFVDAKEVKSQKLQPKAGLGPEPGPLTIGMAQFGNQHIGCDGLIDEVRISKMLRDIKEVPKEPPAQDADTVGLWHFDALAGFDADPAWTPHPVTGNVPAWWKETDKDWIDPRFRVMDTGNFFNGTIAYSNGKKKDLSFRATAIRLGDKGEAAVLFDRNQLRYAAGWTGAFLFHTDKRFGLLNTPTPAGEMAFATGRGLGWANPDGKWDNPHTPFTALPEKWGKFHGIYRHGKRTVLSYSVNGTKVLDSPDVMKWGECALIFRRVLEIAPNTKPMKLLVCDIPAGAKQLPQNWLWPAITFNEKQDKVFGVRINGDIVKVQDSVSTDNSRVELQIAPHDKTVQIRIHIWHGPSEQFADLYKFSFGITEFISLKKLTVGVPAQWTAPITTKGHVEKNDAPYVIDTLTVPYNNPYKALMFTSGLDFMPNGDIAVCTAHGDVWLVSGVDDKLDKLTWKRFATGLYQPLGLKVVDGKILVLERGQLTRLHDLDGDGEADFYECVNDHWHISGGEHSYDTCLETDPDGNFYFFNTGDTDTPTGGCLMKVTKDGKKAEIFATGFRHPIGLSVSPDGVVAGADQEGNWMPATRIDIYKKGGFYGDMRAHHQPTPPKIYDGPLCWLPRIMDNSAGGQIWVPPGKFGPLGGQLLHLSYGRCRMLLVLKEEVDGVAQGGAVDLNVQFLSGVMRGRYNPMDGHIYVCGLDGWQTAAIKDGCLQRVRYTGKPAALPVALHVHADGVRLTFSQPVVKKLAADLSRYHVQQWNYKWTADYGSKHWSVKNSAKEGQDDVPIQSVTLLPDGKSVFLKLAKVQPVMQMQISYNLTTADGQLLEGAVYNTIHKMAATYLSKGQ